MSGLADANPGCGAARGRISALSFDRLGRARLFMMGAGLISLLVAEQRTKRAHLVIEPKGVFVSGEVTDSVNFDPRQSSDHRARSLRALYEAIADNAALMTAAEPTDRDSKPVLRGRFWSDRDVGPTEILGY